MLRMVVGLVAKVAMAASVIEVSEIAGPLPTELDVRGERGMHLARVVTTLG